MREPSGSVLDCADGRDGRFPFRYTPQSQDQKPQPGPEENREDGQNISNDLFSHFIPQPQLEQKRRKNHLCMVERHLQTGH